jgi:D-aminopeptidase
MVATTVLALATLVSPGDAHAQKIPDARALGVPLEGRPGPNNAITDVPGVEVGHVTIIRGEGELVVGEGPVRTGVTAILPRGRAAGDSAFAAWFSLNGNGEMTGTTWIEESGILESPVLITNTHSVGVVRDAVIDWMRRRDPSFLWALPVVAETYDGNLNDINGFHVKPEHVFGALDGARPGPVQQGAVGGGTGSRGESGPPHGSTPPRGTRSGYSCSAIRERARICGSRGYPWDA